MDIIEETPNYKIIEFDDDDLDADRDLFIINKCVINDIKYKFINKEETQIKIFKP